MRSNQVRKLVYVIGMGPGIPGIANPKFVYEEQI